MCHNNLVYSPVHITCHFSWIGQVSFRWPLGKGWGRAPQPAAAGQNDVTYRHVYSTRLVVGRRYLGPICKRLLGNPVFNALWKCQSWDPGEEGLPYHTPFGCPVAVNVEVDHPGDDYRPCPLFMRVSWEFPLQRSGIPSGHPACWGAAGTRAHRVISQIAFTISFMSKAKTTWTVWEFALKWAPAGWYRDSYKTFDPSATTAEVLRWSVPLRRPPACSVSCHLCKRKRHQPSATPAPPAPGCCCRWELGRDFNATRCLRRVSRCAWSCYQRHKRKKALLTFPYVTQSNSSACGFSVFLGGRREWRWV